MTLAAERVRKQLHLGSCACGTSRKKLNGMELLHLGRCASPLHKIMNVDSMRSIRFTFLSHLLKSNNWDSHLEEEEEIGREEEGKEGGEW